MSPQTVKKKTHSFSSALNAMPVMELLKALKSFLLFFRGSAAALADSQILRISQRMITSLTDLKTNPAKNW